MSAAYAGPDCELRPNPEAMTAFLGWWFEKCNRGVIEIGWLDAGGRGLIHFEQFERDDIASAVASATQANLVPGQACYVRASTVHPKHRPDHYTTDMDFEQAPGIWGDIDTLEDFERAKTVQTIVRPNGSVITGTVPHMRVQSWFRCSEPIVTPELVRGLNVRLHKLYGGDPAVVNPSRLMRLPGTIAWPWKVGRIPEVTSFVRPGPDDPRPSSYPLSMLTSQLPKDQEESKTRPSTGERATLNSVSELIRLIKEGVQWHNNMVRLVAHWVGRGWSTVEILTAAEPLTLPGYSTRQTIDEVLKMIQGARVKWGVEPPEHIVGGEAETPFGETIFDPWGTLQAPSFPSDALPDVLREYVEERARVIGADPCAIAWSALSACSAALDGRTRLRMKRHDAWSVPPSLWVALIGRSSSKKTPIIADAWRPLEQLQNVALRAYADQVAAYNRIPKEERKDTSPPPRPIRLLSHDATMESIQDILAGQDRGIGVLRDELAGFIGSLDKYSSGGRGGAADRAFFLQAYNGGNHVVDRIGRGTVAINNLLITICGGIQPDRLAQFSDLADDGMWQRFVPIIVNQGEMGTDEDQSDAGQNFTLRLQGLVDASNGDVVALSEGAHNVRAMVEREIFELERAEPLGGRFASFTGKLAGMFGRLCLVLSYVQPRGLGYIVSETTAQSARTLITKCVIPHAARVYMTMGDVGGSLEITQSIASFILTKKLSRVVLSDLTSGVRACRNQTVQEIGRMLSPLVAGAWIVPESELPGNRSWTVNPLVHTTFAGRAAQEAQRKVIARAIMRRDGDD